MKRFLFFAAGALALVIAGATLARSGDAMQTMFSPNWIEGIATLWIPFLFAFVIVGFGSLALQRINR